ENPGVSVARGRGASTMGNRNHSATPLSRHVKMMAVATFAFATIYFGGATNVHAAGAQAATKAAGVAGTAGMAGSVDAPKPFKAARVYIRNKDKRMLYMVFTNAGNFRANALFPGNYEVSAQAIGLESDIQNVTVKVGERPTVKIS